MLRRAVGRRSYPRFGRFFARDLTSDVMDPKTRFGLLAAGIGPGGPINFVEEVVERHAEVAPDAPAVTRVDSDDPRKTLSQMTYEELVARVNEIAGFLSLRFEKGDVIGLLMDQEIDWVCTTLACMRLGLVFMPMTLHTTPREMAERLRRTDATGVVVSAGREHIVDDIRLACPQVHSLITTGHARSGWESLGDVGAGYATSLGIETVASHKCLIFPTSGTTSQSKLVVHGQDYPWLHWPTAEWMGLDAGSQYFNASDPAWGFSYWTLFASLLMRGHSVLMSNGVRGLRPSQILRLLAELPIDTFAAGPHVLKDVVHVPGFEEVAMQSLAGLQVASIGQPLQPALAASLQAKDIKVRDGYGQAETLLQLAQTGDQDEGTLGRPTSLYRDRMVVVDDHLNPVPNGVPGQIAIDISHSRVSVMHGYHDSPEENHRAFRQGLYLTGDVAERRSDGAFVFCGRRPDIFKDKDGYTISPAEVEAVAAAHPAVAHVALLGMPTGLPDDSCFGHLVVVLKPGYDEGSILKNAILDHIAEGLSIYKVPRSIAFMSQEEWGQHTTFSSKISHAGLRQKFRRILGPRLSTSRIRAAAGSFQVTSTGSSFVIRPTKRPLVLDEGSGDELERRRLDAQSP